MLRIPGLPDDAGLDGGAATPAPPRAGSAAPGVGEELFSAAVELPWDQWLGIAAAHAAPARMPHAEGREPHAWWLAAERRLVWMPWVGVAAEPYGLELLESGQAEAVSVIAPDAVWTVFRTELPRRGARGGWGTLPQRFRDAVAGAADTAPGALERGARWGRRGDTITVRWREGERLRSVSVVVNRPDPRS